MNDPKSSSPPDPGGPGPILRGRRAVLGALVALVGATSAVLAAGRSIWRRRGPRERDLSEANFYGPHDLAG